MLFHVKFWRISLQARPVDRRMPVGTLPIPSLELFRGTNLLGALFALHEPCRSAQIRHFQVECQAINLLLIKAGLKVSMDEGGRRQHTTSSTPRRDEDIIDSGKDVLLEAVSSNRYALTYTFFLIPDSASFRLTGELADLLPKWLEQICLSHGWKLEFATVDSAYLQWGLSVPPVVATGQIIQQVRSGLTEQIRGAFKERIEIKVPTDFWAPGYLLLYGGHPHTSEIVKQYIHLIRRRQSG